MSGFGLNKVLIMGNLTRDPELKQLNNGQNLCKIGIASSRNVKGKSGEMTQEVCFVDIDVWGAQAENCSKSLEKGSSVLVEGRLRWDSWVDQTGAKRSRHSVVADRVIFLKGSGSAANSSSDFDKGEISLDEEDAFKDELPF